MSWSQLVTILVTATALDFVSDWKDGAGDGDRTRNQRLGKPLLYH